MHPQLTANLAQQHLQAEDMNVRSGAFSPAIARSDLAAAA